MLCIFSRPAVFHGYTSCPATPPVRIANLVLVSTLCSILGFLQRPGKTVLKPLETNRGKTQDLRWWRCSRRLATRQALEYVHKHPPRAPKQSQTHFVNQKIKHSRTACQAVRDLGQAVTETFRIIHVCDPSDSSKHQSDPPGARYYHSHPPCAPE